MLLCDRAQHHDINGPKYLDCALAVKFASGSVYPRPSGHTSLKDSNRAWLCTTGSRRYEGRVNDTQGVISVNTIHPEPEIHEHIYVTKRLRNNVYNYKHILNNAERNVTNDVNGTTHADELTVQH